MQTLSGRQLGGFAIGERLALGGMASIYRATQISTEREVAVKVLPLHLAGDPKLAARFEREARVLASLQHPHILPLIDFGREGEWLYLVTPLIPHGDLADRLARWGEPLPLDEVRTIMRQLTDALDAAHRAGIVHRDLKPANVLIDAHGNCLLSDFGIAKLEGAAGLTSAGVAIGTPEYMAPEQGAGQPVDARCDLYALGVILYELCTHRVPFEAESPTALLLKHLTEPPPPPRTYNPKLSPELERVILKALAKEPANRYASAEAMGKAIAQALPRGSDGTTTTRETVVIRRAEPAPTLVQPPPATPRDGPRRGGSTWAAATAIGVLLGLGVWWWAQQRGSAQDAGSSAAPAAPSAPAPEAEAKPVAADPAPAPDRTVPAAGPVAEATAPCGSAASGHYDDFERHEFDGALDKARWTVWAASSGTKAAQHRGVLQLTTEGKLEGAYVGRKLRPKAVQACVRLTEPRAATGSFVAISVNAFARDSKAAFWWATCYVQAEADAARATPKCTDPEHFTRQQVPAAPVAAYADWHLLRVEFPTGRKLVFSVDGTALATFDVAQAVDAAAIGWSVSLNGWSADGKPVAGEFDDVDID